MCSIGMKRPHQGLQPSLASQQERRGSPWLCVTGERGSATCQCVDNKHDRRGIFECQLFIRVAPLEPVNGAGAAIFEGDELAAVPRIQKRFSEGCTTVAVRVEFFESGVSFKSGGKK